MNDDGPPAMIFAARPKKSTSSVRPAETITPLSQNLNVPIDLDYKKSNVDTLAAKILSSSEFDRKVVVICWVRETITDLLEAFGVRGEPNTWPENLFDRALVLDFDQHRLKNYRNIPQHLLPGDTN